MDRLDKQKNPVTRPSVLLALDKQTGGVVWEASRQAHRACYTTPFILESRVRRRSSSSPARPRSPATIPTTARKTGTGTGTSAKAPLRTIASSLVAEGCCSPFPATAAAIGTYAPIDLTGPRNQGGLAEQEGISVRPLLSAHGPQHLFCQRSRPGRLLRGPHRQEDLARTPGGRDLQRLAGADRRQDLRRQRNRRRLRVRRRAEVRVPGPQRSWRIDPGYPAVSDGRLFFAARSSVLHQQESLSCIEEPSTADGKRKGVSFFYVTSE